MLCNICVKLKVLNAGFQYVSTAKFDDLKDFFHKNLSASEKKIARKIVCTGEHL